MKKIIIGVSALLLIALFREGDAFDIKALCIMKNWATKT